MESASSSIVETPHLVAARAVLKILEGAGRFFPDDLFRDPPLHILLHTFIAREEKRHLGISQLGQACTTTPSTTLRWVVRLEADGYVRRAHDPHDRRRSWIEITDNGCERMANWLYSLGPPAPQSLRH